MKANCLKCEYLIAEYSREDLAVVLNCGISRWDDMLFWPSYRDVRNKIREHGDCYNFKEATD